MRALYGASRSDDVGLYAAMGMSPQEIKERVEAEPQDLGVWPDNWPAFQVFEMMMTQWRVGMGGRSGLDYSALPVVMQWCGIKPAQQKDVLDGVRQMEFAALEYFTEKSQTHGD